MADRYKVRIISPEAKEKIMSKIDYSKLYELKAGINGACIKLFTDSRDFRDMWVENFEPMPEWVRPHARLFATGGERLEVLYEPTSKTAVLSGCDYYGWVKSIALALAAEFFEDAPSEHRRYSIHGSFVDFGGKGAAIIGPPKSGKTTLTYGLLLEEGGNFLTDDWFFVRFAGKDVLVDSSEKNSYVGADLGKIWPGLEPALSDAAKDGWGRAVADVKRLFGWERIRKNSNLALAVLLTREKGLEPMRRLTSAEAMRFMLKNDFCNPHQLARSKRKMKARKGFFKELFSRVPVYLLNTIETPHQSLGRLKSKIEEICFFEGKG